MPRMPEVTSTVDLGSAVPKSDFTASDATASQFGGGNKGSAYLAGQESDLASSLFGAARETNSIDEQQRAKTAASNVASGVAMWDFSGERAALQKGMQPGDPEAVTKTRDSFLKKLDTYLEPYSDPDQRQAVRQRIMGQLPGETEAARSWQTKSGDDNNKLNSSNALDALAIKVTQNPGQYDQFVKEADDVINTANVPETLRPAMRTTMQAKMAEARFRAMTDAAKTPEELDAIEKQIKDPAGDWASKFDPNDYTRAVANMNSKRTTLQAVATGQARSALSSVQEQLTQNNVVDPDTMKSVGSLVQKSNDINLQTEWAKFVTKNTTLRDEGYLPANRLRQNITGASGTPGQLFTNTPPEIVNYSTAASALTGGNIPASFLVGMTHREYGQYFKRLPPSDRDLAFRPVGGQNANLGADMTSAAIIAGRSMGQPLTLLPSTSDGKTLAVSMTGMDDAARGKLTGALVQAGFTGFKQDGDRLEVSVRPNVPNTYTGDFSGYTNLSPSIRDELNKRGFAANAKAEAINRLDENGQKPVPVGGFMPVDYTKGNAAGDSSAQGVGQFVKGTWLDLMKNPATRAALGVPANVTSDDALLALRGNPEMAIKATALYAQQNRAIIEPTLGRPMTDGELYAAHFLGPQGALALFQTKDTNPSTPAAQILPQAAKSNAKVFYEGGDTSKPLSAAALYNNLISSFSHTPTQAALWTNEQRQKILNDQTTAIKSGDQVALFNKNPYFPMAPLTDDPSSYVSRARQLDAAGPYYSVPKTDIRPLSENEVTEFKTKIDSGVEGKVQVMTKLQQLGDYSAQAAAQIGIKDPVFGYAAGLALARNQPSTAIDIFKGQQIATDNPSVLKTEAMSQTSMQTEINRVLPSLAGTGAANSQAIIDAAKAIYAQRYAVNNPDKFSPTEFQAAFHAALGAAPGQTATANVNGGQTVLPAGVTGRDFDNALNGLQPQDLTNLSEDGKPPRFANGDLVNPATIANEGRFLALGGNRYTVSMSDGKRLITNERPQDAYTPSYYIMRLQPDAVKNLAARGAARYTGTIADPNAAVGFN